MDGEVMQVPDFLPPMPDRDFWELHRLLADCYVEDIARLRGDLLKTPSMRSSTRMSRTSGDQSPKVREAREARDQTRRSTIKDRREKTIKSLQLQLCPREDESSCPSLELIAYECWSDSKSKPHHKLARGRTKELVATTTTTNANRQHSSSVEVPMPRKGCTLHPGGSFRTCWNLMMAACVLYDLLMIPLYAFDMPRIFILDAADWLIQIFWNVDFIVSFFTGFYDEGTLIFSLYRIAIHYCKTWMLFDVALISMDWTFRIMEWSNDSGLENIMWSRSLRMLRFLRLMRMLRMVKLRRINEVFQEFFHSQASSLYYSLFSSLIHLCILNHLIACAWFAVSHMNAANWVSDLGIQDDSTEYQYLTCLNWAFAQLGVGSSPAKPTNVVEMAYCIVIAFRSLITSSTLISTVSNLMAGLSHIKEDENTQFRLLRNYLGQNHIPPRLAQKITHFLQYQYALRQQARSADMEVPILELLSPQLLGELQFARFEKQLCRLQVVHDLLESADRQVVHILQRVAQHAVKNHVVAAADVIFLAGNTAHSAQLKLSGALNYCYEDKEEVVTGAHWMAEVALWTPWVYLGDLVSSEVSRVAALDVQGFHDALSSSWQTQRAASHYASGFLAAMGSDSANWTDGFVMQGKVGAKESATVHNETLQTRSFCPCFNRPRVQDFQPVGPR